MDIVNDAYDQIAHGYANKCMVFLICLGFSVIWVKYLPSSPFCSVVTTVTPINSLLLAPPEKPKTLLSSVQPFSHVRLFVTPWIAAHQASLSITNSWSLLKLMSIKSMMPSSHLILCHPLPFLPPIPPSTRVCSNESTLCIRWPKY